MSLKKSFLKSKTIWGAVIAAVGPTLVPALIQNAPVILDAAGVGPGTAGKIVGVAGALLAIYGRAKATAPLA